MTLPELYARLRGHFGAASDPDTWWPVYHGDANPPRFERAITNVLVQNGSWKPVRHATDALHARGLLTAHALATADEAVLAACVHPTGMQAMKAKRLQALGSFVVKEFGTEAAFCAGVTREQLLSVAGIGPETADRTLLYACLRMSWPVDTYCLRVLARYGVIAPVPTTPAGRRAAADAVKAMVAATMPPTVDDWRRLHALFQLEGERLRAKGATALV